MTLSGWDVQLVLGTYTLGPAYLVMDIEQVFVLDRILRLVLMLIVNVDHIVSLHCKRLRFLSRLHIAFQLTSHLR